MSPGKSRYVVAGVVLLTVLSAVAVYADTGHRNPGGAASDSVGERDGAGQPGEIRAESDAAGAPATTHRPTVGPGVGFNETTRSEEGPRTTTAATTRNDGGGFRFTTEAPSRTQMEAEPNDGPTGANTVVPGVPVSGTLDGQLDRDFYAVSAPGGGNVTAELAADGSGVVTFGIFAADRSRLTSQQTPAGESDRITTAVPRAGTYYVVVQSAIASPNPGTGAYDLTLTTPGVTGPPTTPEQPTTEPAATQDGVTGTVRETTTLEATATPEGTTAASSEDPNEPNDELASATLLRDGETREGVLSNADDTEVFAVEASPGENITISIDRESSGGRLTYYWTFPNGRATEPGNIASEDHNLTLYQLGGTGTYYLIFRSADWTGSYTVSASITPDESARRTTAVERRGRPGQ